MLWLLSLDIFIRTIIGSMFLVSGLFKLKDIERFYVAILNYGLLKFQIVPVFAWLIVLSEIIVGVGLIFNVFTIYASSLAMGLLTLFTIAISINLYKGNKIKCGCGPQSNYISISLLVRDLILFLITFYSFLIALNTSYFKPVHLSLVNKSTAILLALTFIILYFERQGRKLNTKDRDISAN